MERVFVPLVPQQGQFVSWMDSYQGAYRALLLRCIPLRLALALVVLSYSKNKHTDLNVLVLRVRGDLNNFLLIPSIATLRFLNALVLNK